MTDNWAMEYMQEESQKELSSIYNRYLVSMLMVQVAEKKMNKMQRKIISLQGTVEDTVSSDIFVFSLRKAANDAVGVIGLVSDNPKWDMEISAVDVKSLETVEITLYCTREIK